MPSKLTFYHSIAISGQACSGKSTLCKLLEKKLGWSHINIGAGFRKLATQYHLDIEDFGSIPEEQMREIDRRITKRIYTESHVIWDGRLACYLSRSFENVLKVNCLVPIEIRAQRLASREMTTLAESLEIIEKRDREEKEVFERLYSLSDPYDSKWINLKLDASALPDVLVNLILNFLT
jgi:cytidylate kinase